MVNLFDITPINQVPNRYREKYGVEIRLDGLNLETPEFTEYSGRIRMFQTLMPEFRRLIIALSLGGAISQVEVESTEPQIVNNRNLFSDFIIRMAGGEARTSRMNADPIPDSGGLVYVTTTFETSLPFMAPHEYLYKF